MPEEVIITKFIGDVSDLEAKVASVTSEMEGYDDAVGKAQKGTADLTAKTGNLAKRTGELITVEKQAKTITDGLAASMATASTAGASAFKGSADRIKELSDKINALKTNFDATVAALVQGGAEPAKAIETTTRSIEELQVELAKLEIPEDLADEAVKALDPLREIEKAAGEASSELQEVGQKGAPALDKLRDAEDRAGDEVKQTNQYIHEEIGLIGQLKSRIDLLNQKKNALGDPKEIAKVNDQIRTLESRLRTLNGSASRGGGPLAQLGRDAKGLRGSLTGAVDSLDNVGVSTGRLSGIFRALSSPIGIAAAAVGGLVYNFLQLDSAQVALDGLKRGFSGLLDLLRSGSVSVSGIIEAFREGKRLAEAQDDLDLRLQKGAIINAEAERSSERLVIQAKDRSKSEAERIVLLEEANRITNAAAEENLRLSKEQAKIRTDEFINKFTGENRFTSEIASALRELESIDAATIDWLRNLKDVNGQVADIDDDLLDAAVKSSVAFIATDNARSNIVERNQSRINTLREQGANEEAQRQEKARADAEKANAERLKRAQEILAAEQKIADVLKSVRDAQFKSNLDERGAQVFDLEQAAQARVDTLNEQFDIEKKLAGENAEAIVAIEIRRADAIKEVRQASSAEITALEKKFYADDVKLAKDALAEIDKAVKSEGQNQADAINARYQKLLDNAAKFITDEDELNRTRAALNAARQRELDGIIDTSEERRLELYKRTAEALGEAVGTAVGLVIAGNGATIAEINKNYNEQLQALSDFTGSEEELNKERLRINQERNVALAEEQKKGNKQFLVLLLDVIEKALQAYIAEVVLAQTAKGGAKGGIPGALAGAAIGAAIGAILSGIVNALKGSIGAYKGERDIGGNGERPMWSGRDGFFRRVDRGEDIVAADKTKRYRKELDHIHKGTLHEYLRRTTIERTERTERLKPLHKVLDFDYAAPMRADFARMADMQHVVPGIERYLSSDAGQRIVASATLPKNYDKNIVEAQNRIAKEQHETNAILREIAQIKVRERSRRNWG